MLDVVIAPGNGFFGSGGRTRRPHWCCRSRLWWFWRNSRWCWRYGSVFGLACVEMIVLKIEAVVVGCSFFRIGKDAVSVVDGLENFLGMRVVPVFIGMMALYQAFIGRPDGFRRSIGTDSEDVVKRFFHCSMMRHCTRSRSKFCAKPRR